jgi:hypothetical protein
MRGPTYRKLSNNGRHDLQNFSVTSIGNVAVVVNEDGIEESWDDVGSDHLKIIGLLNICLDELQDLFLDGS